jgi:hypothetical protein
MLGHFHPMKGMGLQVEMFEITMFIFNPFARKIIESIFSKHG